MSNAMVTIEMNPSDRLRLYGQITGRMEEMGLNPCDWGALDLGFEVRDGWPVEEDAQPTLAELIVVAQKLKLRIVISDVNLFI